MWTRLYIFVFLTVILFSCNKDLTKTERQEARDAKRNQRYNWVLKNGTIDRKYEMALEKYDAGDYYRCTSLLEEVISFKSGSKEFEDALFLFADAYYQQEQYYMSNHYYQRFVYKFPRHEKVEQAEFMAAKSLYMISPKVSLDQTETANAMVSLENFLTKYPRSEFADEAKGYISELEKKIESKEFETAKLHLKIRNYKAAVTSFEVFETNYPNSVYLEEALFLKIEAQYELAKISVETVMEEGRKIYLKKERYEAVKEFYERFLALYPSSEYLEQAEGYYNKAVENLKIK